jgi:hypothetical protein
VVLLAHGEFLCVTLNAGFEASDGLETKVEILPPALDRLFKVTGLLVPPLRVVTRTECPGAAGRESRALRLVAELIGTAGSQNSSFV